MKVGCWFINWKDGEQCVLMIGLFYFMILCVNYQVCFGKVFFLLLSYVLN